MRFNKPRFGGNSFEVFQNGIETFDVADLQNAMMLLRQLDEFCGLGGVVGHRLLDEQMFALLEQGLRELKMGGGGRDDVQRFARGRGFLDGLEGPDGKFFRKFPRAFRNDIVDARTNSTFLAAASSA